MGKRRVGKMEIRLNKKIVFVDDEALIRKVWKEILSEEGYEVFTAGSAEECLELSEKEIPDLIVSDILLPHIDGLALCEEIRRRESLRRVPVILITGVFKDLDFRSRVFQVGADAFFLKPLNNEELLSKIEELLNKWK